MFRKEVEIRRGPRVSWTTGSFPRLIPACPRTGVAPRICSSQACFWKVRAQQPLPAVSSNMTFDCSISFHYLVTFVDLLIDEFGQQVKMWQWLLSSWLPGTPWSTLLCLMSFEQRSLPTILAPDTPSMQLSLMLLVLMISLCALEQKTQQILQCHLLGEFLVRSIIIHTGSLQFSLSHALCYIYLMPIWHDCSTN